MVLNSVYGDLKNCYNVATIVAVDTETSKLLSYRCNCDRGCGGLKNWYVTAATAAVDCNLEVFTSLEL